MKKLLRIIFLGVCVAGIIWGVNYYLNLRERTKDLSDKQKCMFDPSCNIDSEDITKVYEKYLRDVAYSFPRQTIKQIKLFKNNILASFLLNKKLKIKNNDSLISLFNEPDNFYWSETTWDRSEVDYIIRFYDEKGFVVGRIDICLEDCYMVEATPFTPNVKFGHLNSNGAKKLSEYINNSSIWE